MKNLNTLSRVLRILFVWTCFLCILFISFISMDILEYKNSALFNIFLALIGLITIAGIWVDPLCRGKKDVSNRKKSVDIK